MKKNTIKLSDINSILQVLVGEEFNLFIFDPYIEMLEDVEDFKYYKGESKPLVLVNFSAGTESWRNMGLDEFSYILDFSNSTNLQGYSKLKLDIKNNGSGSVRWIYPCKKASSVLAFYDTPTIRSKFISATLRIIGNLGLSRFFRNNSFTFLHKKDLSFEEKLKAQLDYDYFSIFMGTNGYFRTPTVAFFKNGLITHYAKYAFNIHTKRAIANEKRILNQLRYEKFKYLKVPEIIRGTNRDVIVTKSLSGLHKKQNSNLTEEKVLAVSELAEMTNSNWKICNTDFWENIHDNIGQLQNIAFKKSDSELKTFVNLLNQVLETIDSKRYISCSLSHSDFTPWNTSLVHNKLYVYDWEMARNNAPMLSDLIHHVFQSNCILKNKSFEHIQAEVGSVFANPHLQTLINKYRLKPHLIFKLYLLRTVSYQLLAFEMQKELSPEQAKMKIAWKAGLASYCKPVFQESFRKEFIYEFNQQLKRTEHAYLKFDCLSLKALKGDSDLDIMMLKNDIPAIEKYCKEHHLVSRVKLIHKSYMTVMNLFFRDGSFLSIDLIHKIQRKSITLMKSELLLVSARGNRNNVRVPDLKFDFEYAFLFYHLNGADIPERYYEFYMSDNFQRNRIFSYITGKYGLPFSDPKELFQHSSFLKEILSQYVKGLKINGFSNRISNGLRYLSDSIKELFYRRGFIVTVSGVDGVGKSTVISHLKQGIERKYRREVVLLRHRPGILPILSSIVHGSSEKAEKIAGRTKPRMGTNRNHFSSLIRFSYYFLDYLVGQFYVYVKYILRGKIVLYDRYYFDFIVDSKRTNIVLNKRFIRLLYLLVLKPKLNILLWATPDKVYSRKKELEPETISKLTNNYQNLFNRFNKKYKHSTYRIVENKQLDDTISEILTEFAKAS